MNTSLPKKQGLYDPWFEHDACGVGVVANIKGKKSNKILRQALVVLHNMDHRGGQGADMNSGDGAGVLLQIPHNFFVKECAKQEVTLPDGQAGDLNGDGMLNGMDLCLMKRELLTNTGRQVTVSDAAELAQAGDRCCSCNAEQLDRAGTVKDKRIGAFI